MRPQIMSFIMQRGYDVLCKIVSKDGFVEDKKLVALLACGDKRRDEKGYDKEMSKISDLFEGGSNPDLSFWTMELLEAIDKAAAEAFGETRRVMVTDDEDYINALSDYTRAVIDIIRRYRPGDKFSERVVARIRWILSLHAYRPSQECAPIPLVT